MHMRRLYLHTKSTTAITTKTPTITDQHSTITAYRYTINNCSSRPSNIGMGTHCRLVGATDPVTSSPAHMANAPKGDYIGVLQYSGVETWRTHTLLNL